MTPNLTLSRTLISRRLVGNTQTLKQPVQTSGLPRPGNGRLYETAAAQRDTSAVLPTRACR